jgi:hypothetical protein
MGNDEEFKMETAKHAKDAKYFNAKPQSREGAKEITLKKGEPFDLRVFAPLRQVLASEKWSCGSMAGGSNWL